MEESDALVVAATAGEAPAALVGKRVDAMVVPLALRGRSHGALIAIDRVDHGPEFTEQDQELLEAFAASAATAVATAKLVSAEHDRQRAQAVDAERSRWASELQDGPIRGLAAVRNALSAIADADPTQVEERVANVGRQLEVEIANLRELIADLPNLASTGLAAPLEIGSPPSLGTQVRAAFPTPGDGS